MSREPGSFSAGTRRRGSTTINPAQQPPTAPDFTSLPTITGSAIVGQTLTAFDGTVTGYPVPVLTRQWLVNGTPNGSTGSTYVPILADAGMIITLLVAARNPSGTASETSAPTSAVFVETPTSAPSFTVAPTITGTAQVGLTLTATEGTVTGFPIPVITLQWNAAGVAVQGETGLTFIPREADVGKAITITATAANGTLPDATSTSVATSAVAAATPIDTSSVLVRDGTGVVDRAGDFVIQTRATVGSFTPSLNFSDGRNLIYTSMGW